MTTTNTNVNEELNLSELENVNGGFIVSCIAVATVTAAYAGAVGTACALSYHYSKWRK